MTNAHELAERWFDNLTDKYIVASPPTETVNSLALLIHQVAERTRLECAKAIEREKWLDRTSIPRNSVINARWEDEEV